MQQNSLFLVICTILLNGYTIEGATDVGTNPAIFDQTPVSAANPVVARIKECGIAITASDLAGCVLTERTAEDPAGSLTSEQKRRYLNDLIDEHLLVWWARNEKAEETKEFGEMMEATRKMLLGETLQNQEVGAKAKSSEEYAKLTKELHDRLFSKAEINVSNEAYDELKGLAAKLAATDPSTAHAAWDALPAAQRGRPLARYKDDVVTVGDVLRIYLKTDPGGRGNLQEQEGLIQILKEILGPDLMIHEASARGLEKSAFMQEKLQLNRATLLRFYAQDRITDKATEKMKQPDIDTCLKAWFEAHLKDLYTYKDKDGKDRVFPFETEKERIEGDYFEHLRREIRSEMLASLHRKHQVQIEKKLFAGIRIALPELPSADLKPSVIAWDADNKERILQANESNAHFTFQLTNVSENEVTIRNIEPSCKCVTVKSPALPWKMAPGEKGEIEANIDLKGTNGSLNRSIAVESSAGNKVLTLKVTRPDEDREGNIPLNANAGASQ